MDSATALRPTQQRNATDHPICVRRPVGQPVAQRRAVEDVEIADEPGIAWDRVGTRALKPDIGWHNHGGWSGSIGRVAVEGFSVNASPRQDDG